MHFDFSWNADGTFVEKNVCISSCRIFASDSVSLPRFDNPQNVSDKPQTHPWSVQNLEKHGSSQMQKPAG